MVSGAHLLATSKVFLKISPFLGTPRQKEAKKQQALKLAEAKAAAEKAKKEQEKASNGAGRLWDDVG